MRSRNRVIMTVLAMSMLPGAALAQPVLLYDVDFGTPPHTVGLPPVTGAGPPPRDTPTLIAFGDPTVVAALGALTDQPCEFGNGTTGYDQLKFGVGGSAPGAFPDAYDDYHVELDVLVEQLEMYNSVFTVHFDMPTINPLTFLRDGSVEARGEVIGSFTFGVPVFVEVDVDLVAAQWTISLDGYELHTGPINTDGELWQIRLHMSSNYDTDACAVDNFKVYGGAPGCVGDVDGDGDVDLNDLAVLLAAYGTCTGDPDYNPDADLDADGDVDLTDLAGLLAVYGTTCP